MRIIIFAIVAIFPGVLKAGILEEARQILSGGDSEIIRWSFDPDVQIFFDDSRTRDLIVDQLQWQSELTGLNFSITVNKLGSDRSGDLIGYSRWGIKSETIGDENQRSALFTPDGTFEGDIFVFAGAFEFSSHAQFLTGSSRDAARSSMRFARGKAPCYLHWRFNEHSIQNAFVYISNRISSDLLSACVYEELMQAMGLQADAKDSIYFTFDDKPESKTPNFDAELVRSLYLDNIRHGESTVDDVLENFSKQLQN